MWKIVAFFGVLGGFFLMHQVETCNEAVCGSIVSKCLLTQSCKCDLKNCTCCKDCFNCLSSLYPECCSCVDMCPKSELNESLLGSQSTVREFKNPVPALFQVMAESPDPQWHSTTFPIDIDVNSVGVKTEIKIYMQSAEQEVVPKKSSATITVNCTVVFMSGCMSSQKCEHHCQSIGANGFRWFHDGCCECVGSNCINYGINESRCRNCSNATGMEENEVDTDEDMDYDYGQESDL